MKVSSISQYNKVYNKTYNKPIQIPQNNPNFEGVKLDSLKISTINPGKAYLNKLYDLSINASQKTWMELTKELKPFTKEIIEKNNNNIDFIAWDINKDNRKKYIIILHGLSHNITSLQDLYLGITNNTSHAILAPEYKGFHHTNKNIRPSDKDYIESVEKSYLYLKEKNIKDEDISILGHSMGGYVASKFVEKHPKISNLILISPIDSLNYESEFVKKGTKKRSILNKYTEFFIKNFKACRKPFQKMFNIESPLKNITTNTHIIYAKNDRLVNKNNIEQLSNLCQNLKNFIILNSGGHKMEENKINKIIGLLNAE